MIKGTVLRKKVVAHTSALAINRMFGKYKPEQEHSIRMPEVRETEVLKKISDVWKEFRLFQPTTGDSSRESLYNQMVGYIVAFLKDPPVSPEDIEQFSVALANFQDEKFFDEKAGLFLSGLINTGKYGNYLVHTAHLGVLPGCLGYKNSKKLTINGDAGSFTGKGQWASGEIQIEGNAGFGVGIGGKIGTASYGKIQVRGNVDDFAGYGTWGCIIHVQGDAGDYLGYEARGGEIHIQGNAGKNVGEGMNGGEIHIEGKILNIGEVIHGKIFHKGKRIRG